MMTQKQRDALLLRIDRNLSALVRALADEAEDEEPEPRTLDGQPAGAERDQTQSLG